MTAPLTRDQVRAAGIAAAGEIEAIGDLLRCLAASGNPVDADLLRGLALRIRCLAGALLEISDFGDRAPAGDQMKHVWLEVFGPPLPAGGAE